MYVCAVVCERACVCRYPGSFLTQQSLQWTWKTTQKKQQLINLRDACRSVSFGDAGFVLAHMPVSDISLAPRCCIFFKFPECLVVTAKMIQEWYRISWLARWFVPLRHLRTRLSISANQGRTSTSQINKPLPMDPTGKSNYCPNQSGVKWKHLFSWGKPFFCRKETLFSQKQCSFSLTQKSVNYSSFDGMWLGGIMLNLRNKFQLTTTWGIRADGTTAVFYM